jgi:uncharacterized cofD-like protein
VLKTRRFDFKDHMYMRSPHVVAIGGGTGLSAILRGIKGYTKNLTAIVTVGDDGGSSGMLRHDLGILPPGDIRNCILALADEETIMQKLFNYRFHDGSLAGHNFGNLFLAAMNEISNNFLEAVIQTSQVLQIAGKVLPITLEEMVLVAEMQNGTVVKGESKIPKAALELQTSVKKLSLENPDVKTLPEIIKAIVMADIVILGPGSLYTSIIANLLIPQVQEAIADGQAYTYYIANIMTQPGETGGYTLEDHVKAIEAHTRVKKKLVQKIVYNTGKIPNDVLKRYRNMNTDVVVAGNPLKDYDWITDDFVCIEDLRVRHDAELLARRIFQDYFWRKRT